eukprot:366537-Chlamydomonas_euryale.AAC.21
MPHHPAGVPLAAVGVGVRSPGWARRCAGCRLQGSEVGACGTAGAVGTLGRCLVATCLKSTCRDGGR